MTTATTTPTLATTAQTARIFLEPDENGFIRYRLHTESDFVDLTLPFTRAQMLQGLYCNSIAHICEEQPHIAPHIVREIVSRSLPAFNLWPDDENFVKWAIGRCTSAYFLQNFLLRFLDGIERIFRSVPEHLDHSAVEFLQNLCEGDGLQGILEGDPTIEEIEDRLIARARAVVAGIHLSQRSAPTLISLSPGETRDGEVFDVEASLGLASDLSGQPMLVSPPLQKGRQWNDFEEQTTKPVFARKIRAKGRQRKITVKEAADGWLAMFWLENQQATKVQIRQAGAVRGFGRKRIDAAIDRLGMIGEDGRVQLHGSAIVTAQRLRATVPSPSEKTSATEEWRRPLPVRLSEEPVENDFCDVIAEE